MLLVLRDLQQMPLVFMRSSNVGRPLVASAFANNLTHLSQQFDHVTITVKKDYVLLTGHIYRLKLALLHHIISIVVHFDTISISRPPLYNSHLVRSHTGSIVVILLFPLLLSLACPLTCQNGGALNESSCTCNCADGYSGDTCESELQICQFLL